MLLHLKESLEVTFAGCCFGQLSGTLHLLKVVCKLSLWNGQATKFALLHILHAVVVVQLKRFLWVFFTATSTKITLDSDIDLRRVNLLLLAS